MNTKLKKWHKTIMLIIACMAYSSYTMAIKVDAGEDQTVCVGTEYTLGGEEVLSGIAIELAYKVEWQEISELGFKFEDDEAKKLNPKVEFKAPGVYVFEVTLTIEKTKTVCTDQVEITVFKLQRMTFDPPSISADNVSLSTADVEVLGEGAENAKFRWNLVEELGNWQIEKEQGVLRAGNEIVPLRVRAQMKEADAGCAIEADFCVVGDRDCCEEVTSLMPFGDYLNVTFDSYDVERLSGEGGEGYCKYTVEGAGITINTGVREENTFDFGYSLTVPTGVKATWKQKKNENGDGYDYKDIKITYKPSSGLIKDGKNINLGLFQLAPESIEIEAFTGGESSITGGINFEIEDIVGCGDNGQSQCPFSSVLTQTEVEGTVKLTMTLRPQGSGGIGNSGIAFGLDFSGLETLTLAAKKGDTELAEVKIGRSAGNLPDNEGNFSVTLEANNVQKSFNQRPRIQIGAYAFALTQYKLEVDIHLGVIATKLSNGQPALAFSEGIQFKKLGTMLDLLNIVGADPKTGLNQDEISGVRLNVEGAYDKSQNEFKVAGQFTMQNVSILGVKLNGDTQVENLGISTSLDFKLGTLELDVDAAFDEQKHPGLKDQSLKVKLTLENNPDNKLEITELALIAKDELQILKYRGFSIGIEKIKYTKSDKGRTIGLDASLVADRFTFEINEFKVSEESGAIEVSLDEAIVNLNVGLLSLDGTVQFQNTGATWEFKGDVTGTIGNNVSGMAPIGINAATVIGAANAGFHYTYFGLEVDLGSGKLPLGKTGLALSGFSGNASANWKPKSRTETNTDGEVHKGFRSIGVGITITDITPNPIWSVTGTFTKRWGDITPSAIIDLEGRLHIPGQGHPEILGAAITVEYPLFGRQVAGSITSSLNFPGLNPSGGTGGELISLNSGEMFYKMGEGEWSLAAENMSGKIMNLIKMNGRFYMGGELGSRREIAESFEGRLTGELDFGFRTLITFPEGFNAINCATATATDIKGIGVVGFMRADFGGNLDMKFNHRGLTGKVESTLGLYAKKVSIKLPRRIAGGECGLLKDQNVNVNGVVELSPEGSDRIRVKGRATATVNTQTHNFRIDTSFNHPGS